MIAAPSLRSSGLYSPAFPNATWMTEAVLLSSPLDTPLSAAGTAASSLRALAAAGSLAPRWKNGGLREGAQSRSSHPTLPRATALPEISEGHQPYFRTPTNHANALTITEPQAVDQRPTAREPPEAALTRAPAHEGATQFCVLAGSAPRFLSAQHPSSEARRTS